MRIAFYAPLKSPRHPVPSGDRRVGNLLMAALKLAGHEVLLASELRSFEPTGNADQQNEIHSRAIEEANQLLNHFRSSPPDIWFSYHVYYKAPDWIGPRVSKALRIPYIVAEPSHAPKRAFGPWRRGHDASTTSIIQADALLCMTRHDMVSIAPLARPPSKLIYLPPFLDNAPFALAAQHRADSRSTLAASYSLDAKLPWLLSVAMMRPGDKLASYQQLAEALQFLDNEKWELIVVGDGPSRNKVHSALAKVTNHRVTFTGALSAADLLPKIYASADIYVWPAVHEAYGMALLESQASGTPVVASRVRGVPDVVSEGQTALLAPPDDPKSLAEHVRSLLGNRDLRERFGAASKSFVAEERMIGNAALQLNRVIAGLGNH